MGELKKEIFVELDRRIGEVEESLGDQMSDQVGEQIEGEVKRQFWRWRKANKKLRSEFRDFQENLALRHKIPYAVMVVVGVMLFWYGALTIIRITPIINNGIVAFVAGVTLLAITGVVYKKLVG